MKKVFYLALIVFTIGFVQSSKAQVSVNINIGSQPLWGPVGYDYVRYYYLPEVNVYYNVVNRKYTYWKGNKWVTKSKLPNQYRRVDLYRTYKVVVNEPNPWRNHQQYYNRYGRYANNHSQVVIRDARKGRNDSHHNNRSKSKRPVNRKNNMGSYQDNRPTQRR